MQGSDGLFHALLAGLQLLLEAAAGLEAGDGGGLQLAGDLGLGVGVSLRLAGAHLKAAKAGDGHLFVSAQAVRDLVKHCIHRGLDLSFGKSRSCVPRFRSSGNGSCIDILLECPKVTSFGKFCVVEYNIFIALFSMDCARNVAYCARTISSSVHPFTNTAPTVSAGAVQSYFMRVSGLICRGTEWRYPPAGCSPDCARCAGSPPEKRRCPLR